MASRGYGNLGEDASGRGRGADSLPEPADGTGLESVSFSEGARQRQTQRAEVEAVLDSDRPTAHASRELVDRLSTKFQAALWVIVAIIVAVYSRVFEAMGDPTRSSPCVPLILRGAVV